MGNEGPPKGTKGLLIHGIQIFWLIEKSQTFQIHFTLDYEGLKWMKNLDGILHGTTWIVFQGLLDIVSGPSKWGRSNTKLGAMSSNKIVIAS